MSVSTDGIIFYGWLFEEGQEFPWDSEIEDGGDWTSWWPKVAGAPTHDPFCKWDAAGDRVLLPGVTQEMVDDFYRRLHEWEKTNPEPFDVVNFCSAECPIYAIAVPGMGKTANRGFPEVLKPGEFDVDAAAVERTREFCEEHGIELRGEPRWYLASYWG